MLRATLRACVPLSRVATLAMPPPRPPLPAAVSVRAPADHPPSSLQRWSVVPPNKAPHEPLCPGGLLGACPAERFPKAEVSQHTNHAVAGLALDLPSSQRHTGQMELGRGPRRTPKQWEHLVKTRKFVKWAPPPHMRPIAPCATDSRFTCLAPAFPRR